MKKLAILVVGGCGYIGTHMVKALLDAGHDVVTLDNLSKGNRELLPGGAFILGDINDRVVLEQVFTAHDFDAVMHFAAFTEVGESVLDPLKYYQNNVVGTLALLKAMLRHKVDKFIFSSSAAVYGEPEETPIVEAHPCRPTSPYGWTKLMVETVLQDYDRAYGLKSMALRYFNAAGADASGAIGERHEPESHLIPLVLKVATGERDNITIFGTDHATPDGTCVRGLHPRERPGRRPSFSIGSPSERRPQRGLQPGQQQGPFGARGHRHRPPHHRPPHTGGGRTKTPRRPGCPSGGLRQGQKRTGLATAV